MCLTVSGPITPQKRMWSVETATHPPIYSAIHTSENTYRTTLAREPVFKTGESHYSVNSNGFTEFGTHTNEESDENQQKWLPLSDFVGLSSKYIAIPYGSVAFILKTVPNNPMFLISPAQPWWCQCMTISTLLDICGLTGSPRKGFVMRNLDVYLNVRRKKC